MNGNRIIAGGFTHDFSLRKEFVSVNNKKADLKSMILVKKKLIGAEEVCEMLEKQKLENQKLKKMIFYRVFTNSSTGFYNEPAAIKIQSHVKGWICRKSYENVIEN
jgi:IQ calmodulin-binding motif